MKRHKDKHIREAIKYALSKGWEMIEAKGKGHAWAKLHCPGEPCTELCTFIVFGTPKHPEAHAKKITKAVNNCPK